MVNEDTRKPLVGLFAIGTISATLALTFPFVFTRSKLPYMATPAVKVKRALAFLQHRKPRVFVDMGSGDGEAVYQATQFPSYQKVVGIELNQTLYLISQIRRYTWRPTELRRRTQFLNMDMFKYNLSDADTIMIFGVNPLMPALSEKIARECKTGTHILSYRFKIPLSDGKDDKKLDATVIYDEEEMRIYESN